MFPAHPGRRDVPLRMDTGFGAADRMQRSQGDLDAVATSVTSGSVRKAATGVTGLRGEIIRSAR